MLLLLHLLLLLHWRGSKGKRGRSRLLKRVRFLVQISCKLSQPCTVGFALKLRQAPSPASKVSLCLRQLHFVDGLLRHAGHP